MKRSARYFIVAFLFLSLPVLANAEPGDADFDKGYDEFAAKNFDEAARYWRTAAQRGHIRAQNGLAVLLRDGDLGEPDKTQAAFWFRKAADAGYAYAMYSLGILYRDGEGVTQNDTQAYKWFFLASTINFDEKANFQKELLARRMSGDQVESAQNDAQGWINNFFFGVAR